VTSRHDKTRRVLLAGLSALPAIAAGAAEQQPKKSSKTLVVYFSRSGNTRVVAGLIQRRLNADIVELERAAPYPADYLETVAEATRERDRSTEPALKDGIPALAAYDTIYLGFPIWGETAPAVIRSFLRRNDTAGKTLIPFITHGGYGVGRAISVLERHAPKADLKKPFVMEADQERRTMDTVLAWLGERS
jgi:flavodoxin